MFDTGIVRVISDIDVIQIITKITLVIHKLYVASLKNRLSDSAITTKYNIVFMAAHNIRVFTIETMNGFVFGKSPHIITGIMIETTSAK